MEALVVAGYVEVKQDAQSLVYLLRQPNMLFSTGYKVLQGQEKTGFAKCTKVLHNGQDKLVYDITGLHSLDNLLASMQPDVFLFVVANILDSISALQNIGFLQQHNIETTLDKIFVERESYRTRIIYLPVVDAFAEQMNPHYESDLKHHLQGAINAHSQLQTEAVRPLFEMLGNPVASLEQLRAMVGTATGATTGNLVSHSGGLSDALQQENLAPQEQLVAPAPNNKKGFFGGLWSAKKKPIKEVQFIPAQEGGDTEVLDDIFIPSIVLAGVKTPEKIEFLINGPVFVVGKNAEMSNGVIPFSNAVSRTHCKIVFSEGQNNIVDLGSANGTFLNGKKLEPNKAAPIKPGDKIKMANLNFVIQSV